MLTMSRKDEHSSYVVCQGKRTIGCIGLFTIRGVSSWRFIANRRDIAARVPVPSLHYDTAEAALADINSRLD